MSTVRTSKLQSGLGLALVVVLGGLALGCSDSIEGAPTCESKQLVVTGESSGRTISINQSVSGEAKQENAGGTLSLKLSDQSTFTLAWAPGIDSGSVTNVTGSVGGIPGGPLCFGGDSELEIDDASVTFHLAALHACDSSSIVLGEVFGCAGFTAPAVSGDSASSTSE